MLKPALLIITMIMLLLMFAVALIAIIFAIRKPNALNKSMRSMTIAFFAYLCIAFMHYYFQIAGMTGLSISMLAVFSDLCFFILILAWLRVITVFDDRDRPVLRRTRITATALYAVIVEGIVCLSGQCSGMYDSYILPQTASQYVLMTLNVMFSVAVIIYSSVFLYRALRGMENGISRNGTLFFSAVLIVYMLWVMLFDFETIYKPGLAFVSDMTIDPVFIAYCIVDIIIIAIFLRKDPLELFMEHSEIQIEQKVEKIAVECGLTKREHEVVELVVKGMNNPAIADKLCISEYTVKRHLNNIFQKTDVKNRYELIVSVQNC